MVGAGTRATMLLLGGILLLTLLTMLRILLLGVVLTDIRVALTCVV